MASHNFDGSNRDEEQMLKKVIRAKYTPEFKLEAVRLAQTEGGVCEAARRLGLPNQTLSNWVKAEREGRLSASSSGRAVKWRTSACECRLHALKRRRKS